MHVCVHAHMYLCNTYFRKKVPRWNASENVHLMHIMYKSFYIKKLNYFQWNSMFTSHLKTVLERYTHLPNGFCLKSWLRQFSFQGLFFTHSTSLVLIQVLHRCNLTRLCVITGTLLKQGTVYSCYKYLFCLKIYCLSIPN